MSCQPHDEVLYLKTNSIYPYFDNLYKISYRTKFKWSNLTNSKHLELATLFLISYKLSTFQTPQVYFKNVISFWKINYEHTRHLTRKETNLFNNKIQISATDFAFIFYSYYSSNSEAKCEIVPAIAIWAGFITRLNLSHGQMCLGCWIVNKIN